MGWRVPKRISYILMLWVLLVKFLTNPFSWQFADLRVYLKASLKLAFPKEESPIVLSPSLYHPNSSPSCLEEGADTWGPAVCPARWTLGIQMESPASCRKPNMAIIYQDLKQPFSILRNINTSGKHMPSCCSYSRSGRAGVRDLEKQEKDPWQGVVT